MTMNDEVLTEQLVCGPILYAQCSAEIRRGDLETARKHAEALVNRAIALRLRLESLCK